MTYEAYLTQFKNDPNFKALSEQGQQQVSALLDDYRLKNFELSKQFYNQMLEFKEKQEKEQAKREAWGTVFSIGTLGGYHLLKGVGNFFTGLVSGGLNLVFSTLQNIVEIFRFEGRFGDDFIGWAKEFGRDLGYTFVEPLSQAYSGLMSGVAGFGDLVGIEGAEQWGKDIRKSVQTGLNQILYDDNIGNIETKFKPQNQENWQLYGFQDADKAKENIDNRTWQWRKDFANWQNDVINSIDEGLANTFENSYLINDETWVARNINKLSFQVGRMAPNIVASFLGVPTEITSTAFWASNFGNSFNEALTRGASIYDAMEYSLASATIESGLESIGGVMPSGLIKLPNWTKNVGVKWLMSAVAEGVEEFGAELFSGGLESIITDEIDNSNFWARAGESFLVGFVLGGALGGGQVAFEYNPLHSKTQKLYNALEKTFEGRLTPDKATSLLDANVNELVDRYNAKIYMQDDATIQEYISQIDIDPIASLMVEYNYDTKQFQKTDYANLILNDMEGFYQGYQNAKKLSDEYAISKNRTPGIVHNHNIKFATFQELQGNDLALDILDKVDNVAFIHTDSNMQGGYDRDSGFTYLDINLKGKDLQAQVLAHETLHKIRHKLDEKAYNKIKKIALNENLITKLNDKGIVVFNETHEEAYRNDYRKQYNYDKLDDASKQVVDIQIDNLIVEEQVAHIVGRLASDSNLMTELFKISPDLVNDLDSIVKSMPEINNEVNKLKKLLTRYGKQANKLRKGSLIDAVLKGRQQTTFINVGGEVFEVEKENTGFVNPDIDNVVDAKLDEVHNELVVEVEEVILDEPKQEIKETKQVEKQDTFDYDALTNEFLFNSTTYTDIAKNELVEFFNLFDTKNGIENNIDAIIDGIVKYDNEWDIKSYKEITGTKYAYVWNLMYNNPKIKNLITPKVKEKIAQVFTKNEKLFHQIPKNALSSDANIQQDLAPLYSLINPMQNVKIYRDLMALNQIIADPLYAPSFEVKYSADFHIDANKGSFFVYENGLGGFFVDDRAMAIKHFFDNVNDKNKTNYKEFLDKRGIKNVSPFIYYASDYYNRLGFDIEVKENIVLGEFDRKNAKTLGNSFHNWVEYAISELKDGKTNATISSNVIMKSLKVEQDAITTQDTVSQNTKTNIERDISKDTIDFTQELSNLKVHHNNIITNFDKDVYLDNDKARNDFVRNIKKNEVDNKKIYETINKLLTNHDAIIMQNENRFELHNHFARSVLQTTMIELKENANLKGFIDKNRFVDAIEKTVLETLTYVDNTFVGCDTNMLDPNNPKGLQYFRNFHEDLRTKTIRNNRYNDSLNPLFNLIDYGLKLDFRDGAESTIVEFVASFNQLVDATKVSQVNSISLDSKVNVKTIDKVLVENAMHLNSMLDLTGRTIIDINGKSKKEGLLGNYEVINALDQHILDVYAFANKFSLYMPEALGNVILKRLESAIKLNLEVWNTTYNEFWDKDNWKNLNEKNIDNLEKDTYAIDNLKNANNEPTVLYASQVITLRNALFREIVRNRLLDMNLRGGNRSFHFQDGSTITIEGNTKNSFENAKLRQEAKITTLVELFNELNTIVENNAFYKEYNQKLYEYWELLYPYENKRAKDIRGRELQNDNHLIQKLDTALQMELIKDLNANLSDLEYIYAPFRTTESSKSTSAGAFAITNVLDLGIDDGMARGISENKYPALIGSSNNLILHQTRTVANYYAYFRIVNDLNILFNTTYEKGNTTTSLDEQVKLLDPSIVPYFEKLLRDMAGYGVDSDFTTKGFNRIMGILRRNFYKATLGLNLKVVLTQFASLGTMGVVFSTDPAFLPKLIKNVLDINAKKKAQYLIENSEIIKDRMRNSTYEMGEATQSGFTKNQWNKLTEATLKPINLTDSQINFAFYNTLVESGIDAQRALEFTEKGILEYQSNALSFARPQLLRTENQVVKLFTKFLGEPMKMTSNILDSLYNLRAIKRLEKTYDNIVKHFENVLLENQNDLNMLKEQYKALELEKDKAKTKTYKKQLTEQMQELDKKIRQQAEYVVAIEKENKRLFRNIKQVIDSKQQVIKLFGRRLGALVQSLSWQAVLAVFFGMLRGAGKDRDDDESLALYLTKMYGVGLASEFVQMIPFVRDAYSLVVDGFDIDRIDEIGVFNELGRSIDRFVVDIANGGEFNYLQHIRNFSMQIGKAFGMPTKQIERLFTTPTNYLLKHWNYAYRDATGQRVAPYKELEQAIKNNDMKLIETIIKRQMDTKLISFTDATYKEIESLGKQGVNVKPSKVPNKFIINGIEYKNDIDKFKKTYDNATFIVEKLLKSSRYKRLSSVSKGKLINAVYNYYYTLAKQNVSGVKLLEKDRVYNLNQAYNYFNGRTSYYYKQDRKAKKED